MAKTYRVGVALLSHDHIWNELQRWQALPNAEIVAGADDDPQLREKLRVRSGVTRVYDSYQTMLAEEELDVIQIAGGNSEAAEIVEAAAARGLHVISEKPMASGLALAERMQAAAAKAGTVLLINWPTAWHPGWQELERRVLAGEIGTIRYTRYRSAHNGPIAIGCSPQFVADLVNPEINGAGALMDYCCYGAKLAARFLGLPQSVTGMRGFFGTEPAYAPTEDNAILLAKYPHAFGVCEASWSQPVDYAETNPLLYGSEGSLGIWRDRLRLQRPGQEEEVLVPPPTEYPRRSGPEYLLYCLENGITPEGFCSVEVSRNAQEILEAGLRATNTGQTQQLPLERLSVSL